MKSLFRFLIDWLSIIRLRWCNATKINLCSGPQKIPGYIGLDLGDKCDFRLDLERNNLPFKDNSMEAIICISAINYFTRARGLELVKEVFRVLKNGGIARFGVQDMESIAKRYVERDAAFFFQTINGQARFEGPTIGDKFAAWFYGYSSGKGPCRYFYDYESLAFLFIQAGFTLVERKDFLDSRLEDIQLIDNRPDQMFFLEAIK